MNKLVYSLCLSSSIFLMACNSTEPSKSNDIEEEGLNSFTLNDCQTFYDNSQYDQAKAVCTKLFNQGNKKAAIVLGDLALFGRVDGVNDVNKAVEFYEAEGGVKGLYKIARIYEKGINTQIDAPKALSYYERAAQMGDVLSANYVANSYIKGRAVQKDIKKGVNYLTVAADKGDPASQYQLAEFYYRGELVPHDYELAYKYYSLSSQQKNIQALYNKAKMEERGLGTEQNIHKAIDTYKTLIDRSNYAPAQYSLGKLLMRDGDADTGIVYIRQSAKKSYIPAIHTLAIELLKGKNIEKSTTQGIDLLKECINKYYAPCMYTLANVYELGLGVVNNDANSYAWYHIAFDCGVKKAENKMNQAYSLAQIKGLKKIADQKYTDYKVAHKCNRYDPKVDPSFDDL